ncbi:MAG: ribose 5-phosphate isomerase B [Actinobacteria bacterium]|nr:ribose 5-phosphate isomerase B [Actinomycetota bacterium]MEC7810435.1 ribose 5-phosphate isomerase B [Actinomycetota bacterium]MED5276966.1 ribose 5-phosphate isomerase B [Actinomycetota bacterium]|tara:strand:+ start:18697 stop:19140 length:444 start_codon:yes stop_codon:yes gene_type:complete
MKVIAIGCDHAGYELKERLKNELNDMGHEVIDCGTDSTERVDYPDYGFAIGTTVAEGSADLGVAVCGSGIGIGIAANKISGIRAATVNDAETARWAKAHNNANVLCFGERLIDPAVAVEALKAWLEEEFEGGRHKARVAKLDSKIDS